MCKTDVCALKELVKQDPSPEQDCCKVMQFILFGFIQNAFLIFEIWEPPSANHA